MMAFFLCTFFSCLMYDVDRIHELNLIILFLSSCLSTPKQAEVLCKQTVWRKGLCETRGDCWPGRGERGVDDEVLLDFLSTTLG